MSKLDKYNKHPKQLPQSKGNKDVFSKMMQSESNIVQENVNTGLQETTNTEKKKSIKKATFELDVQLHKRLRKFAVEEDATMVEIVEKALIEYMNRMSEK